MLVESTSANQSSARQPSGGQDAAALPLRAYFRCFRGCPGQYSIYDVIYTCPTCGGLLEVHHELEPLRQFSAEQWRNLIDSRVGTTHWPYGSGVWGMREWVAPDLRDENVVSMYEGNSNLYWAERLGKQLGLPDLWVKLCGNSHTGSFKDLGMTVLVSVVKQMMADGSPVQAVACASTGDTSAALAAYAACAGILQVDMVDPYPQIGDNAQLGHEIHDAAVNLGVAVDKKTFDLLQDFWWRVTTLPDGDFAGG